MKNSDKSSAKRWKDLVPLDHAFHLSVNLDESRMPIPIHGHDFAEICWVTTGRGLHRINGRRQELRAGDLIFIRPSDRHGLAADSGEPFRLENVGFPCATVDRLRETYFPEAADRFWQKGNLPYAAVLDAVQLKRLEDEVEWLRQAPRDRFSLDCFLLQLFRILGRHSATAAAIPEWLDRAMRNFSGEECLRGGVYQFYRLAGRSPGHVSRVMGKSCGSSPSAWVNERRVEQGARLLEGTRLSVTEIAYDVGFENLSYFHRIFRARFGTTPLKYRQGLRAVM